MKEMEIIMDQEGDLDELVIRARDDDIIKRMMKTAIIKHKREEADKLQSYSVFPRLKACPEAVELIEGIESALLWDNDKRKQFPFLGAKESEIELFTNPGNYLLAVAYMGLGEKEKAIALKTEIDKGVGGEIGYFVPDSFSILMKAFAELSIGDSEWAKKDLDFVENEFGFVEDAYIGDTYSWIKKSCDEPHFTFRDQAAHYLVRRGLGTESRDFLEKIWKRFNLTHQHAVAGALRQNERGRWQSAANAFVALCEYYGGYKNEGDKLLHSMDLVGFRKAGKGRLVLDEQNGEISCTGTAALAIAYMAKTYIENEYKNNYR
jgi:hypothetical protein